MRAVPRAVFICGVLWMKRMPNSRAEGARRCRSSLARRPSLAEVQSSLHTLNVTLEMDKTTWKKKYRQLVKEHHPDAGGDATEMTCITVAYDTLLQLTPHEKYEYAKLLRQGATGEGNRFEMNNSKRDGGTNTRKPYYQRHGTTPRPSSSSYAYAFDFNAGRETTCGSSRWAREDGEEGKGGKDRETERVWKEHRVGRSPPSHDYLHRQRQKDSFWRGLAKSHFSAHSHSSGRGSLFEKMGRSFSPFFSSSFSPSTRDIYSSFFVPNFSFAKIWKEIRKRNGWIWVKEDKPNPQHSSGSRDKQYTATDSKSHFSHAFSSRSEEEISQGPPSPHPTYYFGMRPHQRARLMTSTAVLIRGMIFPLVFLAFFFLVLRCYRDEVQEMYYLPVTTNVSRLERLHAIHDSILPHRFQSPVVEDENGGYAAQRLETKAASSCFSPLSPRLAAVKAHKEYL